MRHDRRRLHKHSTQEEIDEEADAWLWDDTALARLIAQAATTNHFEDGQTIHGPPGRADDVGPADSASTRK